MTHSFVTLAMLAAVFLSPLQEGSPIRVYIYTAGSVDGFVDGVSKRHLDSVNDLRKSVAKKKGLVVVESKEGADVMLEVLQSGKVQAGETSRTERRQGILGPYLKTTTEPDVKNTLAVALRVPNSDYTVQWVDQDHTWSFMADRIANSLLNWVKNNRSRLQK